MACFSGSAQADPPITPPADPSAVPVVPLEYTAPQPALHQLKLGALKEARHQVRLYRKSVWHWEKVLGRHHTRFSQLALHTRSMAYVKWVLGRTQGLSKHLHALAKRVMVKRIRLYQATVYHWRKVMGQPASTRRQLAGTGNIEQRYNKWRHEADAVLEEVYPSNFAQFACIHHFEGPWNANTGNGYYGGLQMDLAFQSHYGAYLLRTKGTANNWTPLEQIVVAQIAHDRGRGFYPWPNTARFCHLL